MNILIIGSKGFAGRNLSEKLKDIRDGKDSAHLDLRIGEIFEYDNDSAAEDLERYCGEADFVFDLVGADQSEDPATYAAGYGFLEVLLNCLKGQMNFCPVMFASTIQATLAGPFAASEYGMAKSVEEDLLFDYALETEAKVLIYRLPDIAPAEAQSNVAGAQDFVSAEDLTEELLLALEGKEHRCEYEGTVPVPDQWGRYCWVAEIVRK